jgi:DNA-binding IclR family transcriptional regulator
VQDEEITGTVQKTLATLAAELAGDEHELLNIDPRKEYQLQGISAPVFDANGRVRLGLIVTGGLPKMTGAQIRQHAKELVAATDRVSRLIGGTGRPAG